MLRSGTLSATESLLQLLSKPIPLTFMPFPKLIATTPRKDIPLNALLAKLSSKQLKSLTDAGVTKMKFNSALFSTLKYNIK
jgi:hypothetical protein